MDIGQDPSSSPLFIPPVSDSIWMARLAANTDSTLTVPAGVSKALICCDAPFWISVDAEQTLPSSGTFSASNGELGRQTVQVSEGDVIHIKSRQSGDISIAFFS